MTDWRGYPVVRLSSVPGLLPWELRREPLSLRCPAAGTAAGNPVRCRLTGERMITSRSTTPASCLDAGDEVVERQQPGDTDAITGACRVTGAVRRTSE